MDLSIIALIVSGISALGTFIAAMHLRHCRSACMEADFYKTASTPQTPLLKPS